VLIGAGPNAFKIGGETVLFRHEKTFYNPPGLAVLVRSDIQLDHLEQKLKTWSFLNYERVGLQLRPELIVVKDVTGNSRAFGLAAQKIAEASEFNLILMSDNPEVLKAGIAACESKRPLLYAATPENLEPMANLAKEHNLPLAVKARDLEELVSLVTRLTQMGLKDLVLDSGAREPKKVFEDQVWIRRAPLKAGIKALGFPTITFPCEMADNLDLETMLAAMLIAKYAGIVVLSDFRGESLFPLLLERLNIFTDPQRPMTVSQGIYEINGPNEHSPILITTNFSLTYFIVSSEIENSRVPCWLLILNTEGLSVLTAWAAGKFSGDLAGNFVKQSGIAEKAAHKQIIIPGYVASISGEMEEVLTGWQVTVGPREAALIPKFLKEYGRT
jgi:acetyl-CoA decarbonylase/synthase complex subunit gamma